MRLPPRHTTPHHTTLDWLVVTSAVLLPAEVEMDVECKEGLSCQPAVIDLTGSDDEDTPTLPPSPIDPTTTCLQDLLSGDDRTLQPERCVVDLM